MRRQIWNGQERLDPPTTSIISFSLAVEWYDNQCLCEHALHLPASSVSTKPVCYYYTAQEEPPFYHLHLVAFNEWFVNYDDNDIDKWLPPQ